MKVQCELCGAEFDEADKSEMIYHLEDFHPDSVHMALEDIIDDYFVWATKGGKE